MKRITFILFLAIATLSAQSQKADSLRIVNARWQVDSLDGMVLKQMHFDRKDCLGSNQFVAFIEIPANSPRRLAFCCEEQRTQTSVQARRHNAFAAINGSFFDMQMHNPICYLRIDGNELGINTPQPSDSIHRKYYQYGTLLLDKGRPVFVVPDSARLAERNLQATDVMTAGPMLVRDGALVQMRTDKTFVTNRHNRTAVGLRADGTILLVVVDGRTRQSEGLSLLDFSRLLRYLGCRQALNLDGGGSTTMYVRGYKNGGLVNHPSDNGRYDSDGERTVSNCISVK